MKREITFNDNFQIPKIVKRIMKVLFLVLFLVSLVYVANIACNGLHLLGNLYIETGSVVYKVLIIFWPILLIVTYGIFGYIFNLYFVGESIFPVSVIGIISWFLYFLLLMATLMELRGL